MFDSKWIGNKRLWRAAILAASPGSDEDFPPLHGGCAFFSHIFQGLRPVVSSFPEAISFVPSRGQ